MVTTNTNRESTPTLTVGRPRLVQALKAAGITPMRCEQSIWTPSRSVWVFACNDAVVRLVRKYYHDNGIDDKMPAAVIGWRCAGDGDQDGEEVR